jgi:HemY protein
LAPRESAFLLLADIEDAETGDQGRIRHWMNLALKAPRDPAWTADGITAPEWRAVSPATGRLDAFEWKTPVSPLDGPIEEGSTAAVDEAIRTLPALAIESRPATPVEETAKVETVEAMQKPVVAATVAEAAPVKTATLEKARETVAVEEGERPFFGLPDDPGVKEGAAKRDGTSGFRLF